MAAHLSRISGGVIIVLGVCLLGLCFKSQLAGLVGYSGSGGLVEAYLKDYRGPVRSLAFSPDGKTLATCGIRVKLWDVTTGRFQRDLTWHGQVHMPEPASYAIFFSPNGKVLTTALLAWKVKTGQEMEPNWPQEYLMAAVSPGQRVAALANDVQLVLWDMEERKLRATIMKFESAIQVEYISLAFSPDSNLLAVSSVLQKGVRVWDTETGKMRYSTGNDTFIETVAFSPDGSILAGGSNDGQIIMWDLKTGDDIAAFQAHTAGLWVTDLAFSPDATILASGSWDGSVKLWDVAKRHELAVMGRHSSEVWDVAFSSDGKRVASVSRGYPGGPHSPNPPPMANEVILWDVAMRKRIWEDSP